MGPTGEKCFKATEMDQGVVHYEPTSSEPHPDVKVLELIVIAINGSL